VRTTGLAEPEASQRGPPEPGLHFQRPAHAVRIAAGKDHPLVGCVPRVDIDNHSTLTPVLADEIARFFSPPCTERNYARNVCAWEADAFDLGKRVLHDTYRGDG
jgi:hypothetical protein